MGEVSLQCMEKGRVDKLIGAALDGQRESSLMTTYWSESTESSR